MSVITSDNDPDLIWDTMPFALKTLEVMLTQDPPNIDLQLALIGIFGGFCTIVEAVALTVMYTLIIETCVYRDLNLIYICITC